MTKEVVITLDGPSGCGKSSVSQILAQRLHFKLLDSGALYRLVALLSVQRAVDAIAVSTSIDIKDIIFLPQAIGKSAKILYQGTDISVELRNPKVSQNASKIAVDPNLRKALIPLQRGFYQKPGLVAEGRDMGTTIFPNAQFKFYLTATLAERASRRYKQLHSQGQDVSIEALIGSIGARDKRDSTRDSSPLAKAENAKVIDSSQLSFDQVIDIILTDINVG